MPPLNILYVNCHDAGRQIQPYGCAVATPRMQRLAEEGVLFRQAFCAAPTCSPSRAALTTGQSPHSCGMYGLAHVSAGGFKLDDYSRHLSHFLRNAGYAAVLCGRQHEASDVTWLGYEQVMAQRQVENRLAPGEAAADFLRNRPKEPFFLAAGVTAPHRLTNSDPSFFNDPGPKGDPRYVQPPPHLPDVPETRQDIADFYEAVKIFDGNVGLVLDALADSGLADRTLVLCTTDHGIAFPGMKCNLTDRGLGVLMMMRGPGGFSGGKVIDALVSHLDVFPTICEAAGLTPPPWLEGFSLMPLVRGEKQEVREEIYGEVTYHSAYDPQRCVRTRRWKYIRRFDEVPLPGSAPGATGDAHQTWVRAKPSQNCDRGLSKNFLLDHGWAQRKQDCEQLYDLIFDPMEIRNVAADPANAGVLDDMRGRLKRWMERTGDALLSGRPPAPPYPYQSAR